MSGYEGGAGALTARSEDRHTPSSGEEQRCTEAMHEGARGGVCARDLHHARVVLFVAVAVRHDPQTVVEALGPATV